MVLDTGVFLNHKPGADGRFDIGTIPWRTMVPVRTFEEVRVVVPILVIDELERIKDNRGLPEEKRIRARWTVDALFKWFDEDPRTVGTSWDYHPHKVVAWRSRCCPTSGPCTASPQR